MVKGVQSRPVLYENCLEITHAVICLYIKWLVLARCLSVDWNIWGNIGQKLGLEILGSPMMNLTDFDARATVKLGSGRQVRIKKHPFLIWFTNKSLQNLWHQPTLVVVLINKSRHVNMLNQAGAHAKSNATFYVFFYIRFFFVLDQWPFDSHCLYLSVLSCPGSGAQVSRLNFKMLWQKCLREEKPYPAHVIVAQEYCVI